MISGWAGSFLYRVGVPVADVCMSTPGIWFAHVYGVQSGIECASKSAGRRAVNRILGAR